MAPSDLLDLTTLQNLVDLDDGKDGLLKEMIEIFRDDTPRRLQAILEAAAKGNVDEFSRTAHALKGGSGALGARSLRNLSAELEALGRDGSVDAGADLETRLWNLFRETLAALEAYAATLNKA
jgi:HPt (histidine-containing phosphotransfer) domain-containing protein